MEKIDIIKKLYELDVICSDVIVKYTVQYISKSTNKELYTIKGSKTYVHITELPEDVILNILFNCSAMDALNFFISTKELYDQYGNMFWTNLFNKFYKTQLSSIENINPLFKQKDMSMKMRFLNWTKILGSQILEVNYDDKYFNWLDFVDIHLQYSLMDSNILNCYEPITYLLFIFFKDNIKTYKMDHDLIFINIKESDYKNELLKYLFIEYNVIYLGNLKYIMKFKYLELYLDNCIFDSDSILFKEYSDILLCKTNLINVLTEKDKILLLTHEKIPDILKIQILDETIKYGNIVIFNLILDNWDTDIINNHIIKILSNDNNINSSINDLVISSFKNTCNNKELLQLFSNNIRTFIENGLYSMIKNMKFELELDLFNSNINNIDKLLNYEYVIDGYDYSKQNDENTNLNNVIHLSKNKISLVNKITILNNLLNDNDKSKKCIKLIKIFMYDDTFIYDYNTDNAKLICSYTFSKIVHNNFIEDHDINKLKIIVNTLSYNNKIKLLICSCRQGSNKLVNILLSICKFKKYILSKCINGLSNNIFGNGSINIYSTTLKFHIMNKLLILHKLIKLPGIKVNSEHYVEHLLNSVVIKIEYYDKLFLLGLNTPLKKIKKIIEEFEIYYTNNIKLYYKDIELDVNKSLSDYTINYNKDYIEISIKHIESSFQFPVSSFHGT